MPKTEVYDPAEGPVAGSSAAHTYRESEVFRALCSKQSGSSAQNMARVYLSISVFEAGGANSMCIVSERYRNDT